MEGGNRMEGEGRRQEERERNKEGGRVTHLLDHAFTTPKSSLIKEGLRQW